MLETLCLYICIDGREVWSWIIVCINVKLELLQKVWANCLQDWVQPGTIHYCLGLPKLRREANYSSPQCLSYKPAAVRKSGCAFASYPDHPVSHEGIEYLQILSEDCESPRPFRLVHEIPQPNVPMAARTCFCTTTGMGKAGLAAKCVECFIHLPSIIL